MSKTRDLAVTAWWGGLVLIAAGGCGGPALIADDVIAMDRQPVPLTAYVGRKDLFDLHPDIRRAEVTFQVEGRQIGRDTVDERGRAFVVLEDEEDRPLSYQAHTRAGGKSLESAGRIFQWDPDRVILAVDIDYCIVRTNYVRLLFGRHIPVSPPFPEAREVLAELSKEYQILYLTARPRSMLDRTREWLEHYAFPPGPVVVSDRFRHVLRQLEWKRDMLKQLHQQYPSLLVSFGNRKLDVQSALPNNLLPLIIESIENDIKPGRGDVVLEDWQAVREFFRVNRDVLVRPRRLKAAMHEGARLLQPVRDKQGQYQYVAKCVNCPEDAPAGPSLSADR